MKPVKKVILTSAITALLIMPGCDSFLDEKPQSNFAIEDFFKTEQDAVLALGGAYDRLQTALRTDFFRWGESRSDNYDPRDAASTPAPEFANNTLAPATESTDWSNLYKVISAANFCIKNFPSIQGANMEDLLSEALALRAFSYFYLVRLWGDAPLFTDPIESIDDQLIRPKTGKDIILQEVIIPDLIRAETLSKKTKSDFRISKGSILALQAQVYAWIGNNLKAKEALGKLLDLNNYSVVAGRTNWIALHQDAYAGSGEIIWALKWVLAEDEGAGSVRELSSGVMPMTASASLQTAWTAKYPTSRTAWEALYGPRSLIINDRTFYGDWRMTESFNTGATARSNARRVRKYNKVNTGNQEATDQFDYPLMRFSGILLLKAEVENKLGNVNNAIDEVNKVLSLRDLPLLSKSNPTHTNQTFLANFILEEQRFELFAEGQRWFDLIRNQKAVSVMNAFNSANTSYSPMTNDKLLWPVNIARIIESQNVILQNDAYK